VLLVRDIPPVSTVPELAITRPEIYFGELTENYVIVGTSEAEFDYPSGDQNVYSTYAGAAGVPLGGGLGRLMFASAFGASQILLSPALTPDSQVLYYRSLRERWRCSAPFLLRQLTRIWSSPTVAGLGAGRLHLQRYPYSAHRRSYGHRPRQGQHQRGRAQLRAQRGQGAIDAYDGSTAFTSAIRRIRSCGPGRGSIASLFSRSSDAGRRAAQLRYPEPVCTQATMYATYHMRDPRVLYKRGHLGHLPGAGRRQQPARADQTLRGGACPIASAPSSS
jgi:uncharacterized membrane protein (UPF0182 family)